MKDRNMRTRMCVVLFASLFSSVAFADFSLVTDRDALDGTDFIDWGTAPVVEPVYALPYVSSPASFISDDLVTVSVEQINYFGVIVIQPDPRPTPGAGFTNFQPGDSLYDTQLDSSYSGEMNPLVFSGFDGLAICGLGTQIVPIDPGSFVAQIQAFDIKDGSMTYQVSGLSGALPDGSIPPAEFIGVSSDEALSSVVISVQSTAPSYSNLSRYAVNRVELRACGTVPHYSCNGFAAPMADHPVKAKKNRVFPLKMELFDADGYEQTDVELLAAPVVTVKFMPTNAVKAVDVSGDVLPSGQGSDGNQFEFTNDDIWQFNLKSNDHSAPGTYEVRAVSGDTSEYVIDPTCVTSFTTE